MIVSCAPNVKVIFLGGGSIDCLKFAKCPRWHNYDSLKVAFVNVGAMGFPPE